MADYFYRGFWTALDWIYPPVCVGCGEPGFHLCFNCRVKIRRITGKYCQYCGKAIKTSVALCDVCKPELPPYAAIRNFAHYEGIVQDCVHALKYTNNQGLGEVFSEWLAGLVIKEAWKIDLVMPVPLSDQRIHERGYNQSALIARPMAARLHILYHPFGLQRNRDTLSQVGLSAEERRMNVAGAFEAVPEIVAGKIVLLVDDVMTTGSTLAACSSALKDADAKAVYCLTVARIFLPETASHSTRHSV
jgi:competence protein ComFC